MSRGKGFTTRHLNDELFSEILKNINPEAALKSWSQIKVDKFGYITDIIEKEKQDSERLIGLFCYELEYTVPNSKGKLRKKIMMKSKPRSHELYAAFTKLIPDSEKEFLKLVQMYASKTRMGNLEYKELEAVSLNDETVKSIMPKIYWSQMVPDQDIFVFAMEYLDSETVSHMHTIMDIQQWKEGDVLSYLEGLAAFHARFYNQTNELPASLRKYTDISYNMTVTDVLPFWEACLDRNLKTGVWTRKQEELGQVIMRNILPICDMLNKAPKTFAHGDLNLTNECLRKDVDKGTPKLCVFDWDTCTLAAPQFDVLSFLAMMFPEREEISKWKLYTEKYYQFLIKKLETKGVQIEFVDFEKVFDMCACVEYATKHNWCCALFGPVYRPPFFPRLIGNLEVYVEYVKDKYNLA